MTQTLKGGWEDLQVTPYTAKPFLSIPNFWTFTTRNTWTWV